MTDAIYVATNGNDSWSGLLAHPNADGTDGPKATLGAAQTAMHADGIQVALVEGGTYGLGNNYLHLTGADSGDTWSSYGSDKVTITGTGSQVVYVDHAYNVDLHGLTLTNPNSCDLKILGSSGTTVSNGTFTDASTGIIINYSQYVTLRANEVADARDMGILVTPTSNHLVVASNYIHDIGIGNNSATAPGIWYTGSSYDLFTRNTISNIARDGIAGGSSGLSGYDASHDDTFTYNTITGANQNSTDGGGLYLVNHAQTAMNDVIAYNTITNTMSAGSSRGGNGIYLDDFASGNFIHDNLVESSTGAGIDVHLGWNNTVANNVVTGSRIGLALDSGPTGPNAYTARSPMTGNVFENNTVSVDNGGIADFVAGSVLTPGDWVNNSYGGPGAAAKPFAIDINHATSNYSFGDWVSSLGQDVHGSMNPSLTASQAIATLT